MTKENKEILIMMLDYMADMGATVFYIGVLMAYTIHPIEIVPMAIGGLFCSIYTLIRKVKKMEDEQYQEYLKNQENERKKS